MESQNVIELRRRPVAGCWEAYYLGPHAGRVTELFGVPALPTAFTHEAEAGRVIAEVQRLNPGVVVQVEKWAQTYRIEFDGIADWTLAEIYDAHSELSPEFNEAGYFGEVEISRQELCDMRIGETRHFAGGAAPLGVITRIL